MKDLICIICPRGCRLHVNEKNYAVEGNYCPRGAQYGKNEISHPVRVLTSIVKIDGAIHSCCPVKTDAGIPKNLIFDAMKELQKVRLTSPVKTGQIVVKNILGTNVNWVVTKNM